MKRLVLLFFAFIHSGEGISLTALPGKDNYSDIIINEILYDPSPTINLPAYEYVELYNRGSDEVNLGSWILKAGSRWIDFPDYTLPGNSFLLLCYRETENFYDAVHKLGILSSKTLFSNSGSRVVLMDPDSVVVDWVEYFPGMHSGEYYAEGGWSLERIDPGRKCYSSENWTTSADRSGGSPGRENSVLRDMPDLVPPEIHAVYLVDTMNVCVEFSEVMDAGSVLDDQEWYIEGMGHPDSLWIDAPRNMLLNLRYNKTFTPGVEYIIEAGLGVRDCGGMGLMYGGRESIAIPVEAGISELLISEVLFNPLPHCPRFVEVFNPTEKTFDLADLRMGEEDITLLSAGHRSFFPGEYLVFTEDREMLCSYFTVNDTSALVEVPELPLKDDRRGKILLRDKYLDIIDGMEYSENMHNPILRNPEGVSLERLSFSMPSSDPFNWHSASSLEGYGTPGRENSQHYDDVSGKQAFTVEPEVFSPDMDGVNDILYLRYSFRDPGTVAGILVFDPAGRLVRDLGSGVILGTEGFLTWDGTNRYGEKAGTGVYIIMAEFSNPASGKKKYKKTCVLTAGGRY